MAIKVLHFANTRFFLDVLMRNKLLGLKARGFEIHTAAAPAHARFADFPFYAVNISRNISLIDTLAIYQLVRLIKSEGFDLLHTHTSKAGIIGRTAAAVCKMPCIHTAHGLPFYEGQNRALYNISLTLEKGAAQWSSAVLSQSREELELMRKLKFPSQLYFEGNGVDCDYIEGAADRESVRKEWGISEDGLAIGMFARLEPIKGHMDFLCAFEKACAKDSRLSAIIGGSNFGRAKRYGEGIIRAIELNPLQPRIKVLGFCEDVPRLLSGLDVLVLPSKKEGMPRIVAEAMAAGIPVIGSDVVGTRELIDHGKTGFLYKYSDIDALCGRILELAGDSEMRNRMGRMAIKRIRENYDESQVISRIAGAYALVLESLPRKNSAGKLYSGKV